MPIGAAIGAGASLLSGILGSNAASKAAAAQQASQEKVIASNDAARDAALATNRDLYNSETKALSPYQTAGTGALAQLAAGTATGGAFNSTPTGEQVLAQDPGYDFRLQEGQKALERAEAAGGSVGSGGALKAGIQYGQNFASGEYQNAYQRFLDTRQANYSNLANLANYGQNANSQFLGATGNYGGEVAGLTTGTAAANANALTNIGDAQASGYVGGANRWAGALSGLANAATATPVNASGYGGAPDINTPTWDPVTGEEVYPAR